MTELLAHSPLGGSSAYRWITCPGSVRVAVGHEDPESEYASLGTAAHTLAAYCLAVEFDAWEFLGQYISDGDLFTADSDFPPMAVPVDKNMADAVQVYLDAVRKAHPNRDQGNTWIERRFHCPTVHPLMYGQGDVTHLESEPTGVVEQGHAEEKHTLHVWDYKHGIGIVVEVENNPQLMYYGVGMLTELGLWDTVEEVVLHVAQPRGFHYAGPIRSWPVSTRELAKWRDEVLVPAMDVAAEVSRHTEWDLNDLMKLGMIVSGEHCRFCPARFAACPALVKDMEEMKTMVEMAQAKGGAPKFTNDEVGRFLSLFETAKIVQKAARETGFVRAEHGQQIPGWKLAKARSNRGWKDEAEVAAEKAFGKDAMTTPVLKSPAQIDGLPKGKAFTAEYAFKPDAGHQLVPDTDNRPEAGPKAKSMFKPIGKGGKK